MILTTVLTLAGFLMIARMAVQEEKNPFLLMGAGVSLVAAVAIHLSSGMPSLYMFGTLAAEFGVGFLLAAGLMTRHRVAARPWFALGAVSLLVATMLLGGLRLFGDGPQSEETVFLVELGPDDQLHELAEALDAHDAHAEQAFPSIALEADADLAQVFLVFVPVDRSAALRAALVADAENVDHIELNRSVALDPPISAEGNKADTEARYLENDPLVGQQWALEAIQGHKAHRILANLTPASRARVAIVDTGIDGRHEDLQGVFEKSPAARDPHGHGSHCAGVAGAATNNGLGIASLNWEGQFVSVVGYEALNASGLGTVESIAQAIIDAATDGSDVISLSLGDRSPVAPKTITDAVAFARRGGAIVVASAGNANEDAADHMPSNIEGVIAVSALNPELGKATFSNTIGTLKRPIAAPGVDILSLKPGGGYVSMSGTSMSTPMVAGLLGVMRALNPDLTEQDAYDILRDTAREIPATPQTGRLINAAEAIQAVLSDA